MGKYRDYTDEDIISYSKEVDSVSKLLGKLNLRKAGGNYSNMKRKLQQLKIDTSNWGGTGWSKGQQLKDWSDYSRGTNLKPHIIKLRGHRCENCELSEWVGSPIPLELDHIDGDRTHNTLDNLKLLCCNCHALTPTWRRRKDVGAEGLEPSSFRDEA